MVWKDTCTPMFTAALFTIAKTWRTDKDVIHTYNGILYSHTKEWNNAICSNMDELGDYHTKWSKSDRERQISWYRVYAESKKKWYKWTCLQNKNRLPDVKNEHMVTGGKGREEG